MRKFYKYAVVLMLGVLAQKKAQAQVGIGTTTPNNHSILELSATDKGLLVPRLSQVERNAMTLGVAEKGMMIFNTNFTRFEFWNGAAWVAVGVPADNLGNHIAEQNIQLGPYYLSNNAMSEGLRIGSGGAATISTSSLPLGNTLLTLANYVSGVYMRMTPNTLSSLGSVLNFDTESDQPIYFKTGGTTDMTLDASGKLGIGTAIPSYKLDVNGDINIASTSKLRVGGTAGTTGQVLSINGSGNMEWATPSGGGNVSVASGSANYIPKWTSANTLSNNSNIYDNGTNVGVGTITPTSKLHVSGDMSITNASNFYFTQNTSIGNGYFTMIYNPDILGSGAPTQTLQFSPRNNNNTGTAQTVEYVMGKYASSFGGYHAFVTRDGSNTLAERVRIDSDGNVGIGTPAPPSLLSVGTTGNGFQVNNTGNIVSLNGVTTSFPSANAAGVLTNDGTGTLTWATSSGITASNGLTATGTNVQLGGTLSSTVTIEQASKSIFFNNGHIAMGGNGLVNPMAADRALTVSAATAWTDNKNVALDLVGNTGAYNTNTGAINFVGLTTITSTPYRRAMISALSGSTATGNGQLAFYTYNGTLNEVMRLTEGRRVAIGTTTPTARFEVVDNVAGSFLDTLSKISHLGTSTASINRVALNVETKGSWSGGNSTGLNVRVSGSAVNYAALFNGGNVGIGTNVPASPLTVNGSVAFPIKTPPNGIYLFTDTDFTVIRATGTTGAFTLPAANTCSGRIYTVVNQSASAITISTYIGFNGSGSTTVAATSSVMLHSNGTNWIQIK